MNTIKREWRLARLLGGLLLAGVGWMAGSAPALAAPVTINGNAEAAAAITVTPNIQVGQNTNFTSCTAGPWNYKLYTFTVDTTGTYTASVVTPTTLNTTFFLRGTYTPSTTPCSPAVRSQFLVSALASGIPNTATFTGIGLTLQANVQYSVLIAFNTPHVGSQPFTFTMNGPGCVAIDTNTCARDPDKNAEVIGLVTAQGDTARRFAAAQTVNFQSRMESLHRRKPESTETGVSASGDTQWRGQPRQTLGLGSDGDLGAGNSMPGSSSMGSNLAARGDPRLLPMGMQGFPDPLVAQASGSGALSGIPLNGTQQNVMGMGIDAWTAGVVNVGKQGSTDSHFSTAGITVGADKRVSEKLVLGVGGGYAHDRQKIGSNGTRNTGDSYSLSVYGSYQPADGFFVDGLLGYGSLRFDALRFVIENGAIASSSRTGSQWFASLAGGYDHEFEYSGRKMLISPYARLDLARTRLNGTTESGGAQFSLNYSAQDIPTTSLALGVRGETTVYLSGGTIARPYFRVEYLHDFAKSGVAQMSFANQLPGVIFQIDSVSFNTNTARLALGSRYQFRNAVALDFYYEYSYSGASNTQVNTLAARVSKTF
ncbi:outer membrane autotransporter barrel domain-containing protein [Polaromonas sp. YR568]|uniref:autotransporter outer membrane beta-barrel domain-containing protein n=1 Tax=Polaromonas sp. YR568 TaxID=1855301 RepID=UPI0008EF7371|nr:autotransporter outer membrane beta-barrel domain-containing protein [Polaromonas sp. YR568]SFU53907.1 outer membrane autotransporter barrel domain-containing protein [Polaromonas sp. YR568]